MPRGTFVGGYVKLGIVRDRDDRGDTVLFIFLLKGEQFMG